MTESLILLLEVLGETRARAVVSSIGTPQSSQAFERMAAVACARRLLEEGHERRTVAYKLAARYDVSLKSAYRRIGEALDLGRVTQTSR